jgi:hypothetical protein
VSEHVLPEDNTITMLPGELIWNKALETTKLRLLVMVFTAGMLTGFVLLGVLLFFLLFSTGELS